MAVNSLMQRMLAWRYRGDISSDWRPYLAELDFVGTLDDDQTQRLVQLARMFEAVVRFDGREGIEVDERKIRLTALQACRLILELGYEPYRYVHRVTFVPGTFHIEARQGRVRANGAADSGGHVALSWTETVAGMYDGDGRNVVYHEFAHILDGYDGFVDGRPSVENRVRWRRVVGSSYETHRRSEKKKALIDEYGKTSEVEFFAEIVEVFFERPEELHEEQPKLYEVLADYFNQRPGWIDGVPS
ncbi:MAG: zinc-dependent peptidase [Actinomycetota bacterium]